MYYLIYKTTNNINKKIYIGCHKTHNIDDSYLGSGILLKRAIKKYGKENFSKEILNIFDNPNDMYNMEAALINETFIQNKNNYNVTVGGCGGWRTINNNLTSEQRKINRSNFKKKIGKLTPEELLKLRKTHGKSMFLRKVGLFDITRQICKNGFLGKTHSERSKQKIGIANAKHQKGENNSQFGTCWIYSLEQKINIKIKKNELNSYLKKGWLKGRKMNFK